MKQRVIVVASLVIAGLALVVSAALIRNAWVSTHDRPTKLMVKGHAQTDFSSDLIVWNATFERSAQTIAEAYPMIKRDAAAIREYLERKGVQADEIVFDAVDINKTYRDERTEKGGYVSVFTGYRLKQWLKVESKNVDKIENVSREISELLNAGIELNSQPPQFYYTKLSDLKVDLLSRASADGAKRAQAIVEKSDGDLGELRMAEMGTFQITAQNSNEEYTWGGTFNTTSKHKTASVTVRMEFALE